MSLEVKIVHEKAIVPHKKHYNDAGYDLFALDEVVLPPWSQSIVDTGLELAHLPMMNNDANWESVMQIWPRSGLAAKLCVDTGAGIIDASYRGPILVLLRNESDTEVRIPYGKSMAQAVVVPCYVGDIVEVTETNETERGATGGIVEEK